LTRRTADASSWEWVCGRNPVLECLAAGRRPVRRVLAVESTAGALREALRRAGDRAVAVEVVDRSELQRLSGNTQSAAAEVGPYPYVDLDEILTEGKAGGEPLLVLLLDMLQDPQNLGTLLRTADAVGVSGVVLPYRGAVGVTPAVVRASAGASEHLRIALANLAQVVRTLQQAGVWVAGLEGSAQAAPIEEQDLRGPLALVVGNEGEGMRRLVRVSCDVLWRIPARGRLESLNAAVAGSLALYRIWEARGFPGRGG
jgi:23S rRNA (guanosine2251-2'-O)-methyltransferase